jgi:hypothetical protein
MNNSNQTTFVVDVFEKFFQYAESHSTEKDVNFRLSSTFSSSQSNFIYGA